MWPFGGKESGAHRIARDKLVTNIPGGAGMVMKGGDMLEGPHFVAPPGMNDVPCNR